LSNSKVIAFARFATEGGVSGDGGMGCSLKIPRVSVRKHNILHAAVPQGLEHHYQTPYCCQRYRPVKRRHLFAEAGRAIESGLRHLAAAIRRNLFEPSVIGLKSGPR
jgi:hypothetical protein